MNLNVNKKTSGTQLFYVRDTLFHRCVLFSDDDIY